jgi:cation transport ATPase
MKYKFSVSGLDCPNCAAKLAAMIEADDAVVACKINFLTERVTVESELSEDAALTLARAYAKKFSSKVTIE